MTSPTVILHHHHRPDHHGHQHQQQQQLSQIAQPQHLKTYQHNSHRFDHHHHHQQREELCHSDPVPFYHDSPMLSWNQTDSLSQSLPSNSLMFLTSNKDFPLQSEQNVLECNPSSDVSIQHHSCLNHHHPHQQHHQEQTQFAKSIQSQNYCHHHHHCNFRMTHNHHSLNQLTNLMSNRTTNNSSSSLQLSEVPIISGTETLSTMTNQVPAYHLNSTCFPVEKIENTFQRDTNNLSLNNITTRNDYMNFNLPITTTQSFIASSPSSSISSSFSSLTTQSHGTKNKCIYKNLNNRNVQKSVNNVKLFNVSDQSSLKTLNDNHNVIDTPTNLSFIDTTKATVMGITSISNNKGILSGLNMKDRKPCDICGDVAAGFHCNAYVCEACKFLSAYLETKHTHTTFTGDKTNISSGIKVKL
ncbi:unnamed protein product [Schistosoma mattheei]|uniref:Nuclear receptor domain-containing protein n=1 Tax=Schistosoma mattheei TaxID=31246 RepID=A0A3P8HN89_9TREM|nr:unnamed protein product [Schistosoma mattheei]